MEDLCAEFGVSISTVRQDVGILVEKGTVNKVYGGVSIARSNPLIPFEERKVRNLARKQAIGKQAAMLLRDRDILFLDSGTTSVQLIPHIPQDIQVTILTHSLSAMQAALPYPHIEVISLPGKLDRRTNAFLAADLRYLEQYNITLAMMAATGISGTGEVTNSILLEQEIKRKAVEKSGRSYLLADSDKFDHASLITYAHLAQFAGVVTDEGISESAEQLIRETNLDLHIATL